MTVGFLKVIIVFFLFSLGFDLLCMRTVGSGKNASAIWDRLVFNKIKDKLGGRVRFMTSGASPLSPEVMEFMKM